MDLMEFTVKSQDLRGVVDNNDLLTGYSVRTRKYEVRSFSYGPSLRGPCVKVRDSYF